MRHLRTEDIPVDKIDQGDRLRPIDQSIASGLAELFTAHGQKTPIEVVAQPRGRYRLLAGAHRVTAAEINGWQTIRADIFELTGKTKAERDIEIQLAEIDENLQRQELSPLDRAIFLGRRQELYEARFPGTKHGAQGGRGGHRNEDENFSFSKATSQAIGMTDRTIQRATRIYKRLPADLRKRLQGTHLARSEGDLYALTQHGEDVQIQIVDACLRAAHENKPGGEGRVAFHAARLGDRDPDSQSPTDAQAEKLRLAWVRANTAARIQHLEYLIKTGVIQAFQKDDL